MASKQVYYRKRGFGHQDAWLGDTKYARINASIGKQTYLGQWCVYLLPQGKTVYTGSLRQAKEIAEMHIAEAQL